MQERFADNVPWGYHLIPFVTGLIGLIVGVYLVEPYGPLAKTIFPAACLIVGGFGAWWSSVTSLTESEVPRENFQSPVENR